MIDLVRALKYPFAGPNAVVKTLLGGLLVLFAPLLLPLLVLLGYQVRIIRAVIAGTDAGLPEWDRTPEDLGNGLAVLLGTLIYYLPAFVLTGFGAAALLRAFQGIEPVAIVLEGASWSLDRSSLALALVLFLLAIAWMALTAPVVMTAIGRYAQTGSLGAFLAVGQSFRAAWDHRAQAALLMLYLFLLALGMHAIAAAASSACLLPAYIQFLHLVIAAHLNGQWALLLLTAPRPRPVIRPIPPPPWAL